MKTIISSFLFFLIFCPMFVIGQAAGNYYYNQEMSKKGYKSLQNSNDEISLGGANYRNNYQQQTYLPVFNSSNDTSFVLEAKVMMNVKADEYVIVLGAMQVGETIEACHQVINKRIETFINSVTTLGVNKEDVFIDFISQFPIFEVEVEKKLFSK